ncbi:hypothetical protein SAMN02745866_04338 [Alteromonadaceae bacterium Bs31]|nr:hypothetical protein SAMN02745866_04338 [Alteromonadaceae bacterium Bs31]
MKHSAWNPTRRNRNIGTEKSGFSQNNKLVVPERWVDFKVFWERLKNPIACPLEVRGHSITMLIEPPKAGSVHASTPQDIVRVLELAKQEHLEEIEIIVLRQPKKKEEILKPVWGRFVYYADLGKYSGPGIYLEAVETGKVLKWGNKLTPFEKKELESLHSDGHRIERVKRGYDIYTTPETIRNTQLFRTLPHELGHAVDYLTNSLNPSIDASTESDSEYINNTYNSKPALDKEEFANRYAREFYQNNQASGLLPFDRIFEKQKLENMGLNSEWFNY